jgi:hypothetical protein
MKKAINPFQVLWERVLPSGTLFTAVAGSVLDFEGDAIVNAANEGGVTGFGLDGRILKP